MRAARVTARLRAPLPACASSRSSRRCGERARCKENQGAFCAGVPKLAALGLYPVSVAKACGAGKITYVDTSDERGAMASERRATFARA